ncbi:MAG: hypothetical protein V4726_04050 [Verrucomicrobiota bacterium]
MIPPLHRRWRGIFALILAAVPVEVFAQAQGTFIIPSNRANNGTRFSYWQAYESPDPNKISYQYNHLPNLVPTSGDSDEPINYSNWNTDIALSQIGTPTAFVLGAGHGIYSFAAVAKYQVAYTHSGADDVKGVLLQFKMAGSVPLTSVELHYTPDGASAETVLKPNFKALDNPGTAAFAEQLLWAYEWDLTGKGVKNYKVFFSTGSSSNPLYQTQVDTTVAPAFHQELGYLLTERALPSLRYGAPGKSIPDPSFVSETRFFKTGQSFPMVPEPEDGFEHVGWISPAGAVVDSPEPITITFSEAEPGDLTLGTVFSPVSWGTFRSSYFNHEFTHGGQTVPDDSRDDTKSGPAADLDGDGNSNFYEYAFGGLPYTPDAARLIPAAGVVSVEGVVYPSITYRRRAALESDLAYVVEVSSDLVTWKRGTPAQPLVAETNGPLENDGTRTVTARSLSPAGTGAQFLRVKAEIKAP